MTEHDKNQKKQSKEVQTAQNQSETISNQHSNPNADSAGNARTAENKQTNPKNEDAIEKLTAANKALEQEKESYKDLAMRMKADFDNFRKRLDEQNKIIHDATEKKFLLELLTVVDAYELSLANFDLFVPQLLKSLSEQHKKELEQNYKGMLLTFDLLKDFLVKNHVTELEIKEHEIYDPNCHEALLQEQTDKHKDKEILQVLQKGYLHDGKILRLAKVKIAGNNPKA